MTNKLELSHDYLPCLIQTVDLAKKGLKSMEHKQPVSYYSGLLAMLDGSKPLPAIDNLIDDTLLVDLVVPPPLAITNGGEGKPDSEPEDFDIDGVDSHKAVAGSFERWGPFTLRDFSTRRSGKVRKQLLMRCPFHRDEQDPSGTFCYRSGGWTTQAEKKLVRQRLCEWALRGRFVRHRAKEEAREDSHKFLQFEDADMRSLKMQEALLQEASSAPRWSALPGADCDSQASDTESSTSSS